MGMPVNQENPVPDDRGGNADAQRRHQRHNRPLLAQIPQG
jgi:hypothetical protein